MVQILSYLPPEVKQKIFVLPRPKGPQPPERRPRLAEFRPPQTAESIPICIFPGHAPGKIHPAHGAGRLFQRNRGPPRVKSPSNKRLRLLFDNSFFQGHVPWKNTLTRAPQTGGRMPRRVPPAAAGGSKSNPSFPATCASERTPCMAPGPTFSQEIEVPAPWNPLVKETSVSFTIKACSG